MPSDRVNSSRYFSPKRVVGRLKRNRRGTKPASLEAKSSGGGVSDGRLRISSAAAAYRSRSTLAIGQPLSGLAGFAWKSEASRGRVQPPQWFEEPPKYR